MRSLLLLALLADPTPAVTYRIRAAGDARLPAEVTVASAPGGLAASYRVAGDAAARPLALTVIGTDLVLQGETPSGVLTLRLYGQNDPRPGAPVTGRWWLGSAEGTLRGVPRR
ncbi:hypothetical protein [Roseisolibacter sp. H3M3-2]|uniref:hypothetical protein n=1 Tax=Roseisolibacter sp. H3M3-2 TaxID=3031323 RepID=UPI0023DB5778|nr:hypothetical protein [Roseisolibacter sp. H3M3-2]MDF1504769.1 hypothetical protein [Roseisolibacter sp. H3M3-2]